MTSVVGAHGWLSIDGSCTKCKNNDAVFGVFPPLMYGCISLLAVFNLVAMIVDGIMTGEFFLVAIGISGLVVGFFAVRFWIRRRVSH